MYAIIYAFIAFVVDLYQQRYGFYPSYFTR